VSTALETYLRDLRDIHNTGAAVKETSYYGPLANLFNDLGKTLKPKVRCVIPTAAFLPPRNFSAAKLPLKAANSPSVAQ
jgi:hypothetical protein